MKGDIEKVFRVANTRQDMTVPANSARDVHARIAAINRERRRLVKQHEETVMGTSASAFPHPLELVRVCPRFDPPGIEFKYNHWYHEQAYDSAGNPVGSAEEWDWEEYYRLREQFGENDSPSAPSVEAERALMQRLGLTESDIDGLTEAQENAIREAERQKKRALTESEREHIIAATTPPDSGKVI